MMKLFLLAATIALIGCSLVEQPQNLFAGDSIMAAWNVAGSFPGYRTTNVAVSGDNISQTMEILKSFNSSPDATFILVGTNDTRYYITNGFNTEEILLQMQEDYIDLFETAEILGGDYYIFSLNPVNRIFTEDLTELTNTTHAVINEWLKEELHRRPAGNYIDSWSVLQNKTGELKREYTCDGLHLNAYAYTKLSSYIHRYIK